MNKFKLACISIRNKNNINSVYEFEIPLEEIWNRNPSFKPYQSIQEFINSIEGFIKNRSVWIQETSENLTFNITIFNMVNGTKENVPFILYKKRHGYDNKDQTINYLTTRVNNLETQLRNLKEDFDELKKIVSPELEWEEHPNCEIFDNGKRIRNIRNEG